MEEEDALESRTAPIQEGEGDEDITPTDIHETSPLDIQTIQGPITRARARQLNLEVSSLLSVPFNRFENRLLPIVYNVIRNQGEDKETYGGRLGGVGGSQGSAKHRGGPLQLDFGPTRSPGTVWSKTDTQAAYGLGFGRSTYGWKGNFIEFPMEPVPGPNSL